MLRRIAEAAVALAALLFAAPNASALPMELGDRCVANDVAAGQTAIVLNNGLSGADLPVDVPPEGSKMITHWRVQAEPGLEPIAQQLVAFKQAGEEDDLEVGESALETVVGGANEFATRIPVPEYGHIGLRGPAGTLLCNPESEHLAGIVVGSWGVGETRHFKIQFEGVPVTATVEPDRDGDGYGDLTQDKCPWGYSFGSDCPIVLKIPHTTVKPHAIAIEAGPSGNASLQVFGQVSWRPPPTARPGGKPGQGTGKGVTVGLSAGSAEKVAAGTVAAFRLPLPKSVIRRLEALPPRHALRAQLTIRVTDEGGAVTDTTRSVTLKGRKRPHRG